VRFLFLTSGIGYFCTAGKGNPPDSLKGNGRLAQLNRAPDYGSGGWGFESLVGHNRKTWCAAPGFFFFRALKVCFYKDGKKKKFGPNEERQVFRLSNSFEGSRQRRRSNPLAIGD
jgi:hypothetical protein